MIQALLFDLDNCLAAADETGRDHFRPAFDAITAACLGTHSPAQLAAAFEDTWVHAFDWVARRHGFTDAMYQAGFEELREAVVPRPMRGYGDLHVLGELDRPMYLVTAGFPNLQWSKLRMLGIADRFEQVIIDAVDDPNRVGKQRHFESILIEHGYSVDAVLVVGDNPHSELEAGRRMGAKTVQTLRPGVERSPLETYHISHLEELKLLLN